MARARNIKPAFFDNDLLAEIEPLGRLLINKKEELGCEGLLLSDDISMLGDVLSKFVAEYIPSEKSICSTIYFTYKLRNSTGHNLAWDVSFDANTYRELFENVLYSIFHLIEVRNR